MSTPGEEILRVVVASPGDVQSERDSVKRVAEELNRTFARERELWIKIFRWEDEAFPGIHPKGPQAQIDPYLRIEESDVVVVIFGRRVGLGTMNELHQALDSWRRQRRPFIMVYFKEGAGEPASGAEREQRDALEEVRHSLPCEILPWIYTANEFRDLFRFHLTRFLQERFPISRARRAKRTGQRDLLQRYLERVAAEPLLRTALFAGEYQVEPADLLRIVLREVQFVYGDPVRAIRTKEASLPLPELARRLTAPRDAGSIRSAVLLGEAGVGKTTTCRWLYRSIAQEGSAVPVYLPLGEWDPRHDFESWLSEQPGVGRFDRLASATRRARRRLILFLDGWNEQEAENLHQVRTFARMQAAAQDAAVVVTSRPVAALESLWPEGDAQLFEIDRWTTEQLASYFERNGREGLLDRIPPEVRNVLRLPLLAFLLIQRSDEDRGEPLPAFRSVADVFKYVLDRFLKAPEEAPEKDRVLGGDYPALGRDLRLYLPELAYEMTRSKVVQADTGVLESVLGEGDREQFRPFLAHLIHSGLLRCSNTVAAVDPEMTVEEVRALKIAFLHQAFQEYLTAQRFLAPSPPALPADISHDAFWREVPVYLIQSLDSAGDQKTFALRFLRVESPDYLTAARLAREITDPGIRRDTEQEVAQHLVENLRQADNYPYTIEAFGALGPAGVGALRGCLAGEDALNRIFARYEAHLMDLRIAGEADEEGWRPLGRAIYVLGELGDFWIAEHLAQRLSSLRSLHLLYHIGEALLTLARRREPEPAELETIRAAGERLAAVERGDPVTRAQAFAVEVACGGDLREHAAAAGDLSRFLRGQSPRAEHFQDEFWRRAHGIEALAEVAELRELRPVLEKLFEVEDATDYSAHEIKGYRLVQSSILKAVRRCCDLRRSSPGDWREFLERTFRSPRIDENGWACRHLEHLLLRWFGGRNDLDWIREWQASEALRGTRVEAVLANVLWQAS